MFCIYCGEELTHHEHTQENLYECKNCELTFEIYPKSSPEDEIDLYIVEGDSDYLTEDGMENES